MCGAGPIPQLNVWGPHICERGVVGKWSVGVYVGVIGRNCKANKSVKVNLFFSLHKIHSFIFSHMVSSQRSRKWRQVYTTVTEEIRHEHFEVIMKSTDGIVISSVCLARKKNSKIGALNWPNWYGLYHEDYLQPSQEVDIATKGR